MRNNAKAGPTISQVLENWRDIDPAALAGRSLDVSVALALGRAIVQSAAFSSDPTCMIDLMDEAGRRWKRCRIGYRADLPEAERWLAEVGTEELSAVRTFAGATAAEAMARCVLSVRQAEVRGQA